MGPRYSIRFDPEKFESSWARGIRNFEQLNLGFSGFLRTFDFVDELQKISCPTLVLAGTHDWICPPAQAKVIAERIPRAHLKIFQHSAHSIAIDEPEAFQAAVTGFLTKVLLVDPSGLQVDQGSEYAINSSEDRSLKTFPPPTAITMYCLPFVSP